MAQGGTDAKMGAKKMDMMKHSPVTMAARPVRPPSEMPELLSMNTVLGEEPSSEPMEMKAASVQ